MRERERERESREGGGPILAVIGQLECVFFFVIFQINTYIFQLSSIRTHSSYLQFPEQRIKPSSKVDDLTVTCRQGEELIQQLTHSMCSGIVT